MAIPGQTALQRSNLNDFLFAQVGTERNGMTLSVLSVFARTGSDPWLEARRLADLPKREAGDSLAQTIAAMPQGLWSLAESAAIATRLIDLLPARPAGVESRVATLATGWRLPSRMTLVLISIALCIGWVATMMLR